jgi:ELWxxDGT repeat protein
LFILDRAGSVTRRFDFHSHESRSAVIFHKFQGEAFFEATGPDGRDLYKTDGETLTKFEIVPDDKANGGIAMWNAVEFRGELYFAASTSAGGELVKTDGVQTTTFDLNPGSGDSWPTDLQIVGDQLVFQARGADGYSIYSTDGTAITKIADLTPYFYMDYDAREWVLPSATMFARLGDQLFFLGNTPDGFRLHRIAAAPEAPSGLLAVIVAAVMGRRLREARRTPPGMSAVAREGRC